MGLTVNYKIVDASALVLSLWICTRLLKAKQKTQPPGPSGLPYFGNTFQIPNDRQWLKFHEWIRKYGDIVKITVMGQPTIILDSVKAAYDLLDTRGAVYSDRPTAIMAGELVGWNRGLGYSPGPSSPRFREFRRLFHQFIGPRPSQQPSILHEQEKSGLKLLSRLLRDPTNFVSHVRQTPGALILKIAYGYEVNDNEKEDPLVNIAEDAMQGFAKASEPGAFLVDYLPFLKYIPSWIPGAGFKKVARIMWEDRERLYDVPFDFVKTQMSEGNAAISFTSNYLNEKGSFTDEEEELIKAAAASLYSGGADTTPSSLASFILAMTLHPSIQTRAQAELDAILGTSYQRLPSFSDRPNLPFINAIILEILRWNPAVPLGLAHTLTQDDVYEGYFFPKGTVVWANIWTMLHDESIFPNPFEFSPDRFLNDDGTLRKLERYEDPAIGFGFGRRICPGMFLADNSIFIAIAMILYTFNVSKAKDENGLEITPEIEYDGFISHPRPFPCNITPRSKEAEDLINRSITIYE